MSTATSNKHYATLCETLFPNRLDSLYRVFRILRAIANNRILKFQKVLIFQSEAFRSYEQTDISSSSLLRNKHLQVSSDSKWLPPLMQSPPLRNLLN